MEEKIGEKKGRRRKPVTKCRRITNIEKQEKTNWQRRLVQRQWREKKERGR